MLKGVRMAREGNTPEQIIEELREVEVLYPTKQ